MIVNRLSAENCLKYARLELNDLPAEGVIGLSGSNEAGKTSIVETICLALFGRTFSLPAERVTESIRWGSLRSRVALEFTVSGNERYLVTRLFDLDGNHGARLTRLADRALVAKGIAAVDRAIQRLVGFGYDTFIESFYLAQREISTPHPHSSVLKTMAGVAPLEQVGEELDSEIRLTREEVDGVDGDQEQLRAELDTLGLEQGRLGELEQELATKARLIGETELRVAERERQALALADRIGALQTASSALLAADLMTPFTAWQERSHHLHAAVEVLGRGSGEEGSLEREEDEQDLAAIPTSSANETLQTLCAELDRDVARCSGVYERALGYRSRLERALGLISDQAMEGEALPQRLKEIQRDRRRSRGAQWSTGLLLTLLIAVAASAAAGTLLERYLPDSPLLVQYLYWAEQLPYWQEQLLPRLTLAASIALALTLPLLLRYLSLGAERRELADLQQELESAQAEAEREHRTLSEQESGQLPVLFDHALKMRDVELQLMVQELIDDNDLPPLLLNRDRLKGFQRRLFAAVEEEKGVSDQRREQIDEANRSDRSALEEAKEGCESLRHAIEQERGRQDELQRLLRMMEDLEQRKRALGYRMRVREVGLELLGAAQAELTARFNRNLRAIAGAILPRFTERRYQHLMLDEALRIRVFANAKNDFVALEELSSGTQRQVMLSVRLALAQAEIEAAIRSPQFVVLDEPFAFFDPVRTREALAALPQISEQLTQFWIISQEFRMDVPFTLQIEARRESDELMVSGGA